MASIEYIQARIEGKEKEITKLNKKIERIKKAEESNWEVNPYYYDERDLRITTRDLEAAKTALENYKTELKAAQEKAESRNVKAIVEFLDAWKSRMSKWYRDGLQEYYTEHEAVRALNENLGKTKWGTPEYNKAKAEFEAAWSVLWSKCNGYFEKVEKVRNGRKYEDKKKVRDGELEYIGAYNCERTLEAAMKRVEKDLTNEANRKYDFIIERVNEICGKITDAAGLRVGAKGDLNGYIIGENGKAKVQTIGAGGYNIQCYHFRTLINRQK